jgi:4-hydroxy-tetrahydrodipicolinate synthase
MTGRNAIRGVWCATLTPLSESGAPDHGRLADHVRRLFAAGVDGVAPFGTTGEGQSFSVAERSDGIAALVDAGIPADRIVAATGCAALPDTIELTRAAVRSGCAGALVLPPFFFKDVGEDGLHAYYAQLIDAVADPELSLYLYHIPQVTSVAIPHDVIARLIRDFPGVVRGIKDSGGDLGHTRRLLARFPELAVFVGHEPHLPAALAAGGAGTICGVANLYPRLVRRLHDGARGGNFAADLARVEGFIETLANVPLFATFKALLATLYADPQWGAVRAPLVALDPDALRSWMVKVAATGIDPARDAAAPAPR